MGWPYTRKCGLCKGTGKRRKLLGGTRPCWRCAGLGHRPTLANRLYQRLRYGPAED